MALAAANSRRVPESWAPHLILILEKEPGSSALLFNCRADLYHASFYVQQRNKQSRMN